MRLAFVMESILMAAIGMAFATWIIHEPNRVPFYRYAAWGRQCKDAADGFLAAAALAGCLGVWIERARRRSPLPWGPGRWAWSVVGLYILLECGLHFTRKATLDWKGMVGTAAAVKPSVEILVQILAGLPAYARHHMLDSFRSAPPYILIAVWLTYRAAFSEPCPRADGREWAGRVFAVLVAIAGIMNLFGLGGIASSLGL